MTSPSKIDKDIIAKAIKIENESEFRKLLNQLCESYYNSEEKNIDNKNDEKNIIDITDNIICNSEANSIN